jgi:hypothetical protein
VTDDFALRSRRELVVLTAELQRATILRRIERIQSHPARRAVEFAARVMARPAALSLGVAAARFALRACRSGVARLKR